MCAFCHQGEPLPGVGEATPVGPGQSNCHLDTQVGERLYKTIHHSVCNQARMSAICCSVTAPFNGGITCRPS